MARPVPAARLRASNSTAGPRPKLSALSRILIGLEGFLAFWAFAGSYAMIADPHGGVLDVELLDGSPFDSFIIPGITLLVTSGLFPVVVLVGALRRAAWANSGHLAVGVVLVGWISAQVMFIGYVSWMQPTFFIYGLLVIALALLDRDH